MALGVLVLGAEAETLGQKSLPSLPSPFFPTACPCLFLLNETSSEAPAPSLQATCCSSVEITALKVHLPLSSFLTFLSDHNGVAWAACAQGPPWFLQLWADLISARARAGDSAHPLLQDRGPSIQGPSASSSLSPSPLGYSVTNVYRGPAATLGRSPGLSWVTLGVVELGWAPMAQ